MFSWILISAVMKVDMLNGKAVAFKDGEPFFPIGVTYHFYRHKDTWDHDLKLMKELGLNTIRADIGWAEVEKQVGQYDFSLVDQFLGKAKEYGFNVIMSLQYNSGGPLAPASVVREYRDVLWQMLDYRGKKIWGSHVGSPGNSFFRQIFSKYVAAFSSHLSQWDNVVAIQVWNEPHFPENGPTCDYNPEMISKFKAWLKNRYGDIARLNRKWGTNFSSFDEADPPRVDPSSWWEGSFNRAAWQDWREFNYFIWSDFEREMLSVVKKNDPNVLTLATDMAWWLWGQGAMSAATPLNYAHADVAGFDIYPGGISERDVPAFIGMMINSIYHYRKPVWMTEINNKNGNPSKDAIMAYVKDALKEYVSGVLYFEWSDANSGIDGGEYGLVNSFGEPKPQYHYFKEAVEWLKENWRKVLSESRKDPRIYIYWSRINMSQTFKELRYSYAPRSAYKLLYRHGLRIEILSEDDFIQGNFKKGVPIVFPEVIFMNEKAYEKLREVIKNGTNPIIADVPFAEYLLGENGLKKPGARSVSNLFGLKVTFNVKVDKPVMKVLRKLPYLKKRSKITGLAQMMAFRKGSDVVALAGWKRGGFAVALGRDNRFMLVGTSIFHGELWKASDEQLVAYQRLLLSYLKLLGCPLSSKIRFYGWEKEKVVLPEKVLKGVIDDFEEGVGKWGAERGVKLEVSSSQKVQGRYALMIRYRDDGSGTWFWRRVHAPSMWNRFAYVEFWAKGATGGETLAFELTFNKDTPNEKKYYYDYGALPTRWTRYLVKAPVSLSDLGVVAFRLGGAGTVYVDNIRLLTKGEVLSSGGRYMVDDFSSGVNSWQKWSAGYVTLTYETEDSVDGNGAMKVDYDDGGDIGGMWIWKTFPRGSLVGCTYMTFYLKELPEKGVVDERAIFEVKYADGKKIRTYIGDIPQRWKQYRVEIKDAENIVQVAFCFHGDGTVLVDKIEAKGEGGTSLSLYQSLLLLGVPLFVTSLFFAF